MYQSYHSFGDKNCWKTWIHEGTSTRGLHKSWDWQEDKAHKTMFLCEFSTRWMRLFEWTAGRLLKLRWNYVIMKLDSCRSFSVKCIWEIQGKGGWISRQLWRNGPSRVGADRVGWNSEYWNIKNRLISFYGCRDCFPETTIYFELHGISWQSGKFSYICRCIQKATCYLPYLLEISNYVAFIHVHSERKMFHAKITGYLHAFFEFTPYYFTIYRSGYRPDQPLSDYTGKRR